MTYVCPVTGVHCDPLAARRAIVLASKGRFNDAVAASRGDDPVERAKAEGVLVAVARAVFSLSAIDPKTGQGVSDADALSALTQLTRWLSVKKEKARPSQTAPPCTGCGDR